MYFIMEGIEKANRGSGMVEFRLAGGIIDIAKRLLWQGT